MPFYERLTRRPGTRDTLRANRRAYDRLAEVTGELDDPAKAAEQLRAAIDILERLSAEHPDKPAYQHQLAKQRHNLAARYFNDPATRTWARAS